MMKSDIYPIKVTLLSEGWNPPATNEDIKRLSSMVPSNVFVKLEKLYQFGDGFADGVYDKGSKIYLWPLGEVISNFQVTDYILIGDYMIGSDFVAIDFKEQNHSIFLLESFLEICPSLDMFLSNIDS